MMNIATALTQCIRRTGNGWRRLDAPASVSGDIAVMAQDPESSACFARRGRVSEDLGPGPTVRTARTSWLSNGSLVHIRNCFRFIPALALSLRQCHQDLGVRRQGNDTFIAPCRCPIVFLWQHVKRRELPPEDGNDFDGHGHQPTFKAKEPSPLSDEKNLSGRCTHDFLYACDRHIFVVQDPHPLSIADGPALRKTPFHLLLSPQH